jgi:hypothetical protein
MARSKLAFAILCCGLGGTSSARADVPAPPPLRLAVSSVTVTEGNSGQTPFSAQVSLSGTYPTITVTVKVTATPGTADENDYIFPETHVTLTTGAAPVTVSGFIVGDTDPEGDQYFILNATVEPSTSSYYLPGAYGRVFITDDDQGLASRLHVEGAVVLEGNQGTTTAQLSVKLEPASTNTVTVAYQTHDNSATGGSDYLPAQGTLTFAPGEVLQTISIDIFGDVVPEPQESFFLWLSEASMALLGTSSAEVVIVNDDPVVHASIADVAVDEGNIGVKQVPITITFDRPAPGGSKVQVSTSGATAVADQDFRSFVRILCPAGGETEMTLDLEVLSDVVPECDEGLFLLYSTISMGDDTAKQAKVLLRNDDGLLDGCPDPFAPVEPRRDGGPSADPAPEPPPSDAGSTSSAPEPPSADAGSTAPPAPEPRSTDGSAGETKLDGGVPSDLGPASAPVEVSDAQLIPDLAPTSPTSDSGGPVQPAGKLAQRSGCSCRLGDGRTRGGRAVALLLATFCFAIRRR